MLALNTSVRLGHYFDEITLLGKSGIKSLHVCVNMIAKPFIRIPFEIFINIVFPDKTVNWISQTVKLVKK